MIKAYYNEFDKESAEWLRQLIKDGLITDGVVDERSIVDVDARDIIGFDRVHWFAGVGVWDYCLNESGWGDRPVWTASLPCQPFSAAGKQLGKADERHLLPNFLDLVKECRPDTIFGEQVSRAIQHGWLDDLQASMEAENYAVGHCVFGAHSIGAAHIRQRLYWVANSKYEQQERSVSGYREKFSENSERSSSEPSGCSSTSGMGIPNSNGRKQGSKATKAARYRNTVDATGGIDWLYCRDGKHRPIKSGSIKMAHGFTSGMVCYCNKSEKINEKERKK